MLIFIVINEELRRALLAGVRVASQCRLRLHAQGLRQASAFALGAFNALLDPYGHIFPHPRVEEVSALCSGDEACMIPLNLPSVDSESDSAGQSVRVHQRRDSTIPGCAYLS